MRSDHWLKHSPARVFICRHWSWRNSWLCEFAPVQQERPLDGSDSVMPSRCVGIAVFASAGHLILLSGCQLTLLLTLDSAVFTWHCVFRWSAKISVWRCVLGDSVRCVCAVCVRGSDAHLSRTSNHREAFHHASPLSQWIWINACVFFFFFFCPALPDVLHTWTPPSSTHPPSSHLFQPLIWEWETPINMSLRPTGECEECCL